MTKQVKIYHNPRCSKSRETLNLLKENGVAAYPIGEVVSGEEGVALC